MKATHMRTVKNIICLALLFLCGTAVAQAQQTDLGAEERDSLGYANVPSDSVQMAERQRRLYLNILTRSYGDRVALRWAPNNFIAWRYANTYGYNLIRMDVSPGVDEIQVDTLVKGLLPMSISEFNTHFTEKDSIAAIGLEATYHELKKEGQTHDGPGSIGSIIERAEEQETFYSIGMLAAELRFDVAQAMALGFEDRNVKAGSRYVYRLEVVSPDTTVVIEPSADQVEVDDVFKPTEYLTVITDSVAPPAAATLFWARDEYSAYDIERRAEKESEWTKLNKSPYIALYTDQNQQYATDERENVFVDRGLDTLTYYYRLTGYDPFGDKTLPSKPHKVVMNDLMPPKPPMIQLINILRPDSSIYAEISFEKDTVEEDLAGFRVLYFNQRYNDGQWKELDGSVGRDERKITVNVTGLRTGLVAVAAFDRAGNLGPSIPQSIRIGDMKAPSKPRNLRANPSPDGRVILRWSPPAEDAEDVMYYELWYANDSTHLFMKRADVLDDTLYIDTLAVDVNQNYIYYKVAAVDYSTNKSPDSDILQVLRPHMTPPDAARLDTAWIEHNDELHLRWMVSAAVDVDHHVLFRKRQGDELWQVVAIYDGDSIKNQDHILNCVDKPETSFRRRWLYAMETISKHGNSSGLSRIHSYLVTGERVVDVGLKLVADYKKEGHETTLAWEQATEPKGDYYYCIYRKAPDDDIFRFVTSTRIGDRSYTDVLLRPGQACEYYVKIRFRNGAESLPSNIVKVTAPEEETAE